MQIKLTPKTEGFRLFAGAAVAISALAILLGLVPAASAQTPTRAGLTAAGSASALAAPSSSTCHWFPLPASLFVGDPAAWYPQILGTYNRPGQTGVAYKLTGEFPHSTTWTFTAYNSTYVIPKPTGYVLNDTSVIPDPGSVNPFVPGNLVEATPRNYTAWIWPDSIPVPAGLKNVVLYPTKPALPSQTAAHWSVTMRLYHMQPGYSPIAAEPKITAVSAADPSKPVRCPLTTALTFARLFRDFLAHNSVYGPIPSAPEPTTGNKIYFTRLPWQDIAGIEGYQTNGCSNYIVGTVPLNQISVVTEHKVAPFFNNNLVTPATIMQEWPIRYQSLSVGYFPVEYPELSTNTSDAVYTPDGTWTPDSKWVTVFLPSDPRLSPGQIKQARALAQALDYNVIQLPPRLRGPAARIVPAGLLGLRQKAPNASFPYSVLNMPCWGATHDYRTYKDQTSQAFFDQYASSPSTMGQYYIDGVKMTFAQFISQYSSS